MINVDAEVSKHKNVKDRDEMTRRIKEYKNLALQHANDMMAAGQYNTVAFKLQEICDKLPAPRLKQIPTSGPAAPTKTAKITKDERKRIDSDWSKKTSNKK